MKTIFSFFATILFTANAFSQTSSAEVTCRAQAKEQAVQIYSSCITEVRSAQVEHIRAEYQKELAALKNKYDSELKKVAGAKKVSKAQLAKEAKAAIKANKGTVAQTLPEKTNRNEATPVQSVSDETKVVPADSPTTSSEIAVKTEKENSSSDQIEIIDDSAR